MLTRLIIFRGKFELPEGKVGFLSLRATVWLSPPSPTIVCMRTSCQDVLLEQCCLLLSVSSFLMFIV